MLVYGCQIRAARALIRMTRAKLAAESGVAEITIKQFEAGKIDSRGRTVEAMVRALQAGGVEFVDEGSGKGPGVRLSLPVPRLARTP